MLVSCVLQGNIFPVLFIFVDIFQFGGIETTAQPACGRLFVYGKVLGMDELTSSITFTGLKDGHVLLLIKVYEHHLLV